MTNALCTSETEGQASSLSLTVGRQLGAAANAASLSLTD